MLLNVGIRAVSGQIDSDAQAFIDATGITNSTEINAVNVLTKDLKSAGYWDDLVAVYPFVGSTADTHKYNLKDPRDLDAAGRITWVGSLTHTYDGVQGAGGYGVTNINDNSYISSSGWFAYNNLAKSANSDSLFGYPTSPKKVLNPRNNSGDISANMDSNTVITVAAGSGDGFYGLYRTPGNSGFNVWKDGSRSYTGAPVSGHPNIPTSILVYNGTGSTRRLASTYHYNNITSNGQASGLQAIDEKFQTSLGRA